MFKNIRNKIPLSVKLFVEWLFIKNIVMHNIWHFYQPYKCSVCNRKTSRFDPLPSIFKENFEKYGYKYGSPEFSETCSWEKYKCPLCRATDRDRLYFLYLKPLFKTWVSNRKKIKLLEIAPSGALTRYLINKNKKISDAISFRTADLNAEGVDDKVDIMDMKIYKEGSFDFFICSHVLEHVQNDLKAMQELFRILKPGGSGILMVPICLGISEIDEDPNITDEVERWKRFGQNDHIRLYSKNGFVERVRKAGFDLEQLDINYFGKKIFAANGITAQSVLYIVRKTAVLKESGQL